VPIPYRSRNPTMKELLRLREAGDLDGPDAALSDGPRPTEELYDTNADPHEIDNLADDPKHKDTLKRLQDALETWQERVGDVGTRPELEVVAERWPSGEQPETSPSEFYPNAPGNREREPVSEECSLASPAGMALRSITQGAAIGYTTEAGEDSHWNLYTGPIRLSVGETVLRAKAARCGYVESEERAVTVRVTRKEE